MPPPQSLSGKRGLTLQQPKAEGVPSKLSTFSGVVYNGPKPEGAAVREGCMGRQTGMHQALAASYTVHARDLPYQNLAQRGAHTDTWHPSTMGRICEELQAR